MVTRTMVHDYLTQSASQFTLHESENRVLPKQGCIPLVPSGTHSTRCDAPLQGQMRVDRGGDYGVPHYPFIMKLICQGSRPAAIFVYSSVVRSTRPLRDREEAETRSREPDSGFTQIAGHNRGTAYLSLRSGMQNPRRRAPTLIDLGQSPIFNDSI